MLLNKHKPGEEITLAVLKGGNQKQDVKCTLMRPYQSSQPAQSQNEFLDRDFEQHKGQQPEKGTPSVSDIAFRLAIWVSLWVSLSIAATLAALWAIRRLKSRRHTEPPVG